MVTSNADTKLKILLIGNGSIVAFAHSLSRLTLPNLITKQCPTLISSFSRSISFQKYILRSRMSLQRQHKKFEKLNAAFCESLKISILLPTVLNTAGRELFWKCWQLFWRWTPIHFLPRKFCRLWEFWGVERGFCLHWSETQRPN